jgi:hypothetical protein
MLKIALVPLTAPAQAQVNAADLKWGPAPPATRDSDLERVLPTAFGLKLGVWIAMHENLRSTSRCRAVFDGLAASLMRHVD